jgi:hypothetical protein
MVATPTPRFAARPVHADAGCAVYRIRSARGRTAP